LEWGGCKPCLHGSDAHGPDAVGAPELDRHCWIKGELSFESLRQACLEPEGRTFIGATPPRGALPSQVIMAVSATNAPWLKTPSVPLNSGLVGIIGPRGSGKTALADIIELLADLPYRRILASGHLSAAPASTWAKAPPSLHGRLASRLRTCFGM
jgi:hypothetical protein